MQREKFPVHGAVNSRERDSEEHGVAYRNASTERSDSRKLHHRATVAQRSFHKLTDALLRQDAGIALHHNEAHRDV